MKAITLINAGENSELRYMEQPIPMIEDSEVLIKVQTISINPIDIKTRSGKGLFPQIKDNEPIILGWDISGTVIETKSEHFKIGNEVFGMVNFPGHGKGYAEYVAASVNDIALKPQNISHEEAAAAGLAALTAYQSLVKLGKLKSDQKLLVHAAAGGVGHYAVQIAKHYGAFVAGTSSEDNRNFVLNLDADQHIDYHTDELDKQLEMFDIVLDTIGGENIERSLPLVKKGGTLISIPTGLNNDVSEKSREFGVLGKIFTVKSNGEDMAVIAELLKSSNLKSHISEVFAFEKMNDAHNQIKSGRTVGKVVVSF